MLNPQDINKSIHESYSENSPEVSFGGEANKLWGI